VSTSHFRFSEVSGAPNTPGVYSWYYRIELTDKDIAKCIEDVEMETSKEAREEIVRAFLENKLFRYYKEVPYYIALSGQLKPKYEGFIDHKAEVSYSLINRLAAVPNNLHQLKKTLRLAIPVFASPIYIGVATRLRERLLQHVRLIDQLHHLRASAIDDSIPSLKGETEEEDRDHKFAYEVSMVRGFRPSSLVVNTLELPIDDSIRFDLENILNRINYPLCGRN
jgi:hypothetical protein